jgi:hypothetical protein
MGGEWTYLTNYVYDFEWATSELTKSEGIEIPLERIFVTRDDSAVGHQSAAK